MCEALGGIPTTGKKKKSLLNEPFSHPDTFFKVLAKNEEWGPKGLTCLSKIHVVLAETTITLLKGRHTLVSPNPIPHPLLLGQLNLTKAHSRPAPAGIGLNKALMVRLQATMVGEVVRLL